MKSQAVEREDKRDSMIASNGANIQGAIDVIDVKPEPDIKEEIEEFEEIDTVLYDANDVLAAQVQKTEPQDDDGEEEERDGAWDLFDLYGDYDFVNIKLIPQIVPSETAVDSLDGNGSFEDLGGDTQCLQMDDSSSESPSLAESNPIVKSVNKTTNEHQPNSSKRKTKYKCSECQFVSFYAGNFKRHLRGHNDENVFISAQKQTSATNGKRFKCQICELSFEFPCHLRSHKRTHIGEKIHRCNMCPKQYLRKRDLHSHLKVHITEKTLNCWICWQIFETESDKSEHESRCEMRRYECYVCKYSTFEKSCMKRHIALHTAIRTQGDQRRKEFQFKIHAYPSLLKIRCSVCARIFANQSQKDEHERKCKGRRYECYLCQHCVTHWPRVLKAHMATHHTGERQQCNLCEKSYTWKCDLDKHLKKVHGQKNGP